MIQINSLLKILRISPEVLNGLKQGDFTSEKGEIVYLLTEIILNKFGQLFQF